MHADIGAGLTNLDGTVRNLNAGALTQYDLDEYSPLLYATAGVKLPFTGMSAKAEAVYSHGSDIKRLMFRLNCNMTLLITCWSM